MGEFGYILLKRSALLKIVVFFSTLSLYCTFTNLIPLSLSFGVLSFILPVIFFYQKSYTPLLLTTLVLYFYFFLSTLIYSPLAFFDYTFYRRDGNFFVSLLPMLILGLICLNIEVESTMRRFLIISSIINAIAFLLNKAIPGFAGETSEERNYYFFFFITHNAAGGFLSILTAISIAFFIKEKNTPYFLMMLINIASLFATHSRGSILALAGSLGIYVVLKEKFIKTILWFIIIITFLVLAFGYYYWNEMGRPVQFVSEKEVKNETAIELDVERGWTLIDRGLFLWPRAVDLFLKSPLFGTGFGSFNDGPYELEGIPYVLMINNPSEYIFSDAHTHHSYLHILSETGLLGLFLTVLMLILMRSYFLQISSKLLKDAFMIMFWTVILSSMTEHRLFTPAQMLPFFLLTGILIGTMRSQFTAKSVKIMQPLKYKLHFNLPKKAFKMNLPIFKN
jgi:O-antigen ligase